MSKMNVSIAQWNKYKNRIAEELFDKPYDWLDRFDQRKVIHIFKLRVENGFL